MEESMHVGEQETSLQDQSYHTIRRKIVYLDYKPGEKLGVKQLCDDLDMGRTPVREALVRLAQEGLVRTVPQSGTYVSPINLTFAESACYIREHLEKQVIVECCARAASAGIEQLDRAIALQEKAMAEEDRIGFFLSDNLMHRMIFSIACRSTGWSWSASAGCAPPRRGSTIRRLLTSTSKSAAPSPAATPSRRAFWSASTCI